MQDAEWLAEELQRYPCFYEKGKRVYKERDRSSRPEVFFKKVVLRNFTKFKGKHLCQSLFFNKVASFRPQNTFSYRTPPVAASVLSKIEMIVSMLLKISSF